GRPGDPGGLLRLGRLQRGTRLAHGREHLVLPGARSAHAAGRVHISGAGHARDAWVGTRGRPAGPAARYGACRETAIACRTFIEEAGCRSSEWRRAWWCWDWRWPRGRMTPFRTRKAGGRSAAR